MQEQNCNDEYLISLCREDETRDQGFRLLMKQYQERLYWHIRRIVTTHQDADDVIQETFIKVYKNLNKYRGDAKLYTWLYRVATNESLNHLKKKKKRMSVAIDDDMNSSMNTLKADRYFDGNEAQIKLTSAIMLLPDKQKAVFNLRYYNEMSYKDMSEVFDTSVSIISHSSKKNRKLY